MVEIQGLNCPKCKTDKINISNTASLNTVEILCSNCKRRYYFVLKYSTGAT